MTKRLGEARETMQVRAIADEEMPQGHEWAVVQTAEGETLMLVRASTVTRSRESERLLNRALAKASAGVACVSVMGAALLARAEPVIAVASV